MTHSIFRGLYLNSSAHQNPVDPTDQQSVLDRLVRANDWHRQFEDRDHPRGKPFGLHWTTDHETARKFSLNLANNMDRGRRTTTRSPHEHYGAVLEAHLDEEPRHDDWYAGFGEKQVHHPGKAKIKGYTVHVHRLRPYDESLPPRTNRMRAEGTQTHVMSFPLPDEIAKGASAKTADRWRNRPGVNPGQDPREVYPEGSMEANHTRWMPISEVKKYREHDGTRDGQLSVDTTHDIASQLKAGEGMRDPLILLYHHDTHSAYLGEGNHRLAAAEHAGWSHVPVRVARAYDSEARSGRTKPVDAPKAMHLHTDEYGYTEHQPDICSPAEVFPETHLSPNHGAHEPKTAGANGPDYEGLSFRHEIDFDGTRTLTAVHPEHGDVGQLSYSKMEWPEGHTRRSLRIESLDTFKGHHRRGVASQLMRELERRHQGVPIDHGGRTPEGAGWSESLYGHPNDRLVDGLYRGPTTFTKDGLPWDPVSGKHIQQTARVRTPAGPNGDDSDPDPGIMIAIVPPMKVVKNLPIPEDGESHDNIHVTVAYLGKCSEHTEEQLDMLPELIAAWAETEPRLNARVQGVGTFANEGNHVLWAAVDIPGVTQMHVRLVDYLAEHGFEVKQDHSFTPHMTLSYEKHHVRFLPKISKDEFIVREIWCCIGGRWESFPLRRSRRSG